MIKKLFGGSYEDLWQAVIRPPRDKYVESHLGPEKFQIKGKNYRRTDFALINKRGLKLQCSYWEPYDEEREFERLPCVIYLHGNSSSRCEGASEIRYLLPMNITFFAFDFSGCGRSQGEYISLGWYERDDVETVIEYLRKTNKVSTIGLWGRSMGAVTAIMYGHSDPSVAGMVLDSAFASLKILIEELVKDRINMPNFVLKQAIKLVKSTINKKAKFNLDEIEPIKYAKRCFIPALFCHANGDKFVQPHHCDDLYKVYPGDKNKIIVDGDHNTHRPSFLMDSASIFFYNTLQVKNLKEMSETYAGFKYIGNKKSESTMIEPLEEQDFDNSFPYIEDEEAIFGKILMMSKKEYEESQKKEGKNNQQESNNKNLMEESDILIYPPQNNQKRKDSKNSGK